MAHCSKLDLKLDMPPSGGHDSPARLTMMLVRTLCDAHHGCRYSEEGSRGCTMTCRLPAEHQYRHQNAAAAVSADLAPGCCICVEQGVSQAGRLVEPRRFPA
jgi:hypothetical protein